MPLKGFLYVGVVEFAEFHLFQRAQRLAHYPKYSGENTPVYGN